MKFITTQDIFYPHNNKKLNTKIFHIIYFSHIYLPVSCSFMTYLLLIYIFDAYNKKQIKFY